MKKLFTFLMIICILLSCDKKGKSEGLKENRESKQNEIRNELIPEKLNIQLGIITNISSCGDYYTLASKKNGSTNYIFLSNVSNQAIIKINDKKNIFN